MKLDNMFKKTNSSVDKKGYITLGRSGPMVPEGLLRKCNKCGAAIIAEDVRRDHYICPKCGGYFRVHAYRRIEMLADEGSFQEWDSSLQGGNPLEYRGYEEKLEGLREKTGLTEAVVTGRMLINGSAAAVGVCDGRFLMASMGEAVGEKITRAVERATEEGLPLILFACSGGARMQEGIMSLMQMAKTASALKRHSDAGLLYISVLTDPTTGGVTASFAMLGDVILAEPKALIGFAGPRVIEQTIRQKLPKGFQRSEFLLEHGFIDGIICRENMKETLSGLLKLHEKNNAAWQEKDESACREKGQNENVEYFLDDRDAWAHVEASRKADRPVGSDYIERLFTEFTEFHGDRLYGDDKAVIGGAARFHGMPVTVIAQAKGTDTKGNIERNFGMPSPEGYRKALRLMKQAEKFSRPVICFVDTPGAFCGLEAEERGQGEAIARNLYEMSGLKVPLLSVVIGEGGSGGALAMAVADEVWMLENSIYSILSPEGFASILWKDSSKAKEAARVMKLTAGDLYDLGIVERVFAEPDSYTRETMGQTLDALDREIGGFLHKYCCLSEKELTEHRYSRFRRM
ncbi:MAG: acetyl-CoA carboxylase carboxyltransferase subunit beta [Dorea sp.]|nr:acetyl-CoA carboxylase carboxyltransferase subunit beta [Dorea sp.]